ncbi:MAG TPA: hypothetical protein VFH87_10625, partial [Candidatus Udaeobacter sp.]|nr:hypothetical protein [Candidatus Udaeobacter sp.]
MLSVARKLADNSPFVRDMPVGVGIAKDAADKAYYHTDEVASSAGMLISPFKLAGTDRVDHGGLEEQARFQGGKWVRELMEPNAIFPHFMNEVGHAASDFAYLKDIGFRNEINRIFEYVDQHIKDLQLTTGGRSEWTQNPLHSLTNPREFLAGIFNDGRLHKLLNSIDDPFAPLTGAVPARGRDTLFTRLKTAIQNVLVNVFGIGREPAGTLLNRMEELANRGFEIQQRMNLRHRGDIYQQAIQQQLLGGILRPIPKGEGETPLPTWTQGMVIPPYTPTPIEEITGAERIRAENAAIVTRTHISSVIKNHESLLADAQAQLAAGVPGAQEAVNRELTALRSLRHMMLTPRERYALSATEPAPLREERKFPQGVRPEAAPEQPDVWTVTPEGMVLKGPARAPAPKSEEGGQILRSREVRESVFDGLKEGEIKAGAPVNLQAFHGSPTRLKETQPFTYWTTDENYAKAHGEPNSMVLNLKHPLLVNRPIDDDFYSILSPEYRPDGSHEDLIRQVRKEYGQQVDGVISKEATGTTVITFEPTPVEAQRLLRSRVDGQAVLDSMKSAALYVHEDADRIWFRPYDGNYFRDTYGPAFGFNLRWEPRGE